MNSKISGNSVQNQIDQQLWEHYEDEIDKFKDPVSSIQPEICKKEQKIAPKRISTAHYDKYDLESAREKLILLKMNLKR